MNYNSKPYTPRHCYIEGKKFALIRANLEVTQKEVCDKTKEYFKEEIAISTLSHIENNHGGKRRVIDRIHAIAQVYIEIISMKRELRDEIKNLRSIPDILRFVEFREEQEEDIKKRKAILKKRSKETEKSEPKSAVQFDLLAKIEKLFPPKREYIGLVKKMLSHEPNGRPFAFGSNVVYDYIPDQACYTPGSIKTFPIEDPYEFTGNVKNVLNPLLKDPSKYHPNRNKFRIAYFEPALDDPLFTTIGIQKLTYSQNAVFFEEIARKNPDVLKLRENIANLAFDFPNFPAPNILVAQVLVITKSDQQNARCILCHQRSMIVDGEKGKWSISLEEQLKDTNQDQYANPIKLESRPLEKPESFKELIKRGVTEEICDGINFKNIMINCFFFEAYNFDQNFVAIVELDHTLDELFSMRRLAKDHYEHQYLIGIPINEEIILDFLFAEKVSFDLMEKCIWKTPYPWQKKTVTEFHGTSKLRLFFYLVSKHGMKGAIKRVIKYAESKNLM